MIATTSITVRNRREREPIPSNLMRGLENLAEILAEWTWFAETESGPVAVLVATPACEVVVLHKLNTTDDAPSTVLVPLFRQFFRDIAARGMKGYLTWLQDSPVERKLLRLAEKASEIQTFPATLVVGKIPEGW